MLLAVSVFNQIFLAMRSYDATAAQLEMALEMLPMIEDVTVRRFGPSTSRGYDWVVTFNQVLRPTIFGYVTDEPLSYERIEAVSLLRVRLYGLVMAFTILAHVHEATPKVTGIACVCFRGRILQSRCSLQNRSNSTALGTKEQVRSVMTLELCGCIASMQTIRGNSSSTISS